MYIHVLFYMKKTKEIGRSRTSNTPNRHTTPRQNNTKKLQNVRLHNG